MPSSHIPSLPPSTRASGDNRSKSLQGKQPSPIRHRIIVHPNFGPPGGLDVTEEIITAVAHALWKHHNGNAVLTWLEAERLVMEAFGPRQSDPPITQDRS